MFDIKLIFDWLKDNDFAGMARISALLLAPGLVLTPVLSGVLGGSWGLDLDRTITVSKLKTQLSTDGAPIFKPGVAFIVEPTAPEYHVGFKSPPSRLWSSLDEKSAQANQRYLTFDADGITGKPPFLGVGEPVTLVIEGDIDDKIFLASRTVNTDDWQLPSRRSDSVFYSALFSCVFALGMSLASIPSSNRDKDSAS